MNKEHLFKEFEHPQWLGGINLGYTIDDYKIIKNLGEGTFGKVFQVSNSKNETFALKLLKLWSIESTKEKREYQERFYREYLISQIPSDFLIQSTDCGKLSGNPWFTMELCKSNLLNYINNEKILAPDQLAISVLNGLRVLHNKGYSHRDIKPENILIAHNDQVKLSDFGISGFIQSNLTTKDKGKGMMGTPLYMAPDYDNNSIKFKPVDERGDIFSFGVLMFWYFTGYYPFAPYNNIDINNIFNYNKNKKNGNNWTKDSIKNIERVGLKYPDFSEDWKDIILKCLDPDYEKKRYKSVDEILSDLGLFSEMPVDIGQDFSKVSWGLEILNGVEIGKRYSISDLIKQKYANNEVVLTIGRYSPDAQNDISIIESEETPYISRKHATLEFSKIDSSLTIKDGQWIMDSNAIKVLKNSKNGTWINSASIPSEGILIKPGDKITFGDTVVKVINLNKL